MNTSETTNVSLGIQMLQEILAGDGAVNQAKANIVQRELGMRLHTFYVLNGTLLSRTGYTSAKRWMQEFQAKMNQRMASIQP